MSNNNKVLRSETVRSSRVDFKYEKLTMENGLTVLIAPMPGYRTVQASLAVDFGSVDQSFTLDGETISLPAGVAHFLEHKMFESEDGDAFDQYAKTGASANAYTGFDRTCYVFSATDQIDESLDVLLGLVASPYFTEQTIAKEQGIIGQEIRMYEDSPEWQLLFSAFSCLYHNCPIKEDIAGSVESIAQITPQMLYACTDAFYTPQRMVLAVAGNITREQVVEALGRTPLPQSGKTAQKVQQQEPREIVKPFDERTMSIARPVLGVAFKEQPWPREQRATMEVITDLLCELIVGDTTPLYRKLYDEGLVNSGFSGEVFSGEGYASIIFSGETRDPDAVRLALMAEIERLKKEGIGEEDFEICRNLLYGEAVSEFESADDVAGSLSSGQLRGEELFFEVETLASLTCAQVQQALNTLLQPETSAMVVLRPGGDAGDGMAEEEDE